MKIEQQARISEVSRIRIGNIADSYVDSYLIGNISLVKKQIRTKQQLAKIAEYIRENYPGTKDRNEQNYQRLERGELMVPHS